MNELGNLLVTAMTLWIDMKILYVEHVCSTLICRQNRFQVKKIITGQYIRYNETRFSIE